MQAAEAEVEFVQCRPALEDCYPLQIAIHLLRPDHLSFPQLALELMHLYLLSLHVFS